MADARILMTPELMRALRAPLYRAGCDVVSCAGERAAVLEAVSRDEPDALLLNAALFGLDAAAVVKAIRAMALTKTPAVLALFPGAPEEAVRRAAQNGAICLSGAALSVEEVLSRCARLTVADRLPPDFARTDRVQAMLRALSVSERVSGFRYLTDAVELCARDQRCFRQMTRMIYPLIAQKYNAGAASVERLIRHAIETAWLKGDMERQYALFGNTVDEKRGKPTNSEFIARVTEALRLEANL
ncbi:MAG: hypothetical protein J5602_04770 [Clostridia bacterium]|nr:hypothetical protein [Clostridia bacterium]MBO4884605.1 hypothetical protein [Clostridia bacterium]